MLEKPEYEPEWYAAQNEVHAKWHAEIFAKWGLKWGKFARFIEESFRGDPYKTWVFYCGWYRTVKEELPGKPRSGLVYKKAKEHVYRINRRDQEIKSYVEGL